MSRNHLLRSTFIGRQGHAPLFGGLFSPPVQMTSQVAARVDERKASDILDGIREAIDLLDRHERKPSVIVVADKVPDGMIVEAGEVCFMTCSTEGLERIRTLAKPENQTGTAAALLGVPIVLLADLYTSDSPKVRKLAGYYAAAIQGARQAAGI